MYPPRTAMAFFQLILFHQEALSVRISKEHLSFKIMQTYSSSRKLNQTPTSENFFLQRQRCGAEPATLTLPEACKDKSFL